eukprot:g877.t1
MRVLSQERCVSVKQAHSEISIFCATHEGKFDNLPMLEEVRDALETQQGWRDLEEKELFERAHVTVEYSVLPHDLACVENHMQKQLSALLLQFFAECKAFLLCYREVKKAVGTGYSHTVLPHVHMRFTFQALLFNPRPVAGSESYFPVKVMLSNANFLICHCMGFFSLRIQADKLQKKGFVFVNGRSGAKDAALAAGGGAVDQEDDLLAEEDERNFYGASSSSWYDPASALWVQSGGETKKNAANNIEALAAEARKMMKLKYKKQLRIDGRSAHSHTGEGAELTKQELSGEFKGLHEWMTKKAILPEGETELLVKIDAASLNAEEGGMANMLVANFKRVGDVESNKSGEKSTKKTRAEGSGGVAPDAGVAESDEAAKRKAKKAEKKAKKEAERLKREADAAGAGEEGDGDGDAGSAPAKKKKKKENI